ncbi:MAG: periplasmic binding protein/LacI transcriptional regulator, partial [Solirubrobacterales bacterium]|nr:periplasmic binding protein/LacI transcriptional regulator [Solirubrobacterales bacterium]
APRTIGVVDLIRQSPIDDKTDTLIEKAGKELGWTIKVVDGAGDPQKIASAAQNFVNQGVDGLILTSVDANLVRKQLTQAKEKKIPVIHVASGTEDSDLWDAAYAEDETKMASTLVQHIIDTTPNAKVLSLKTALNFAGVVREKAVNDTIKASGGKAEIAGTAEVDLTNPVVNSQKATTDLLTAHPDATSIHAVFDNMAQATVTAVKLKRSKASVYSYFTTDQNVKNLREDTALKAVMDVDLAKTGAVAIDQLLAFFEKQTPIDPDAMDKDPLEYKVIDKAAVEAIGGDGDPFPIDKTLAPFLEKWGTEYAK